MSPGLKRGIEDRLRNDDLSFLERSIFYPLSLLYGSAVSIRNALYASGVLRFEKLPCKVISIGNLTVGGTGKTPMAIHVAKTLQKKGLSPAILSRGYKGKAKGICIVSDRKKLLSGPDVAGDEPYLMAKNLPGVPVVVGPDRVLAGRSAIERFAPDCLILDDGFQHLRLKRDINILLVDSKAGFGNGHLLPRGILREGLSSMKRATAVLVKGKGLNEKDMAELKKHGLKPLFFDYKITGVTDIFSNERSDMKKFKGKRALIVAGLANPASFSETVQRAGLIAQKRLFFPDHYAYSSSDIGKIVNESEGADLIITTEKDSVKIERLGAKGIKLPFFSLDIEIEMKSEKEFLKILH